MSEQRNLLLVYPCSYSCIFFPRRVKNSKPKVHPLAFMGDCYTRRVVSRVRAGMDICTVLLIIAVIIMTAAAANAQDPITAAKTAAVVTDTLVNKDLTWIALFVATAAIIGMIAMGKFMKEMHLEYLKQQVDGHKAIMEAASELRLLRKELEGRPCFHNK